MMGTHGTRTGVGVCRTSWAFTHGSRLLRATTAIDTNRVQSLATRSSVVGLHCGRVLLHPADPPDGVRHRWASRIPRRTTCGGGRRSSSMHYGHARTSGSSISATPVAIPTQREPSCSGGPGWSAEPPRSRRRRVDSLAYVLTSLRKAVAGGASFVRRVVTVRPIILCPAGDNGGLEPGRSVLRRIEPDKLPAARAAAYAYAASAYHFSLDADAATGCTERSRATRRHVELRAQSRRGKGVNA